MKLRVCYSLLGSTERHTCKVELPDFLAKTTDRRKLQTLVGAAIGSLTLTLHWATDLASNIIVPDVPCDDAPAEPEAVRVPPSADEINALATAENGLKELRDIVAHFGVGEQIGFSAGLPANVIAAKLISLWHSAGAGESADATRPNPTSRKR